MLTGRPVNSVERAGMPRQPETIDLGKLDSRRLGRHRCGPEALGRERMATEVMPEAPVMPFVGREKELELLLERWRQTMDDAGQVVLLKAEAGFGKSRLVEALTEATAADSRAVLRGRCTPLRRHTAFAPLIEILHRLEDARDDRRNDPPAVRGGDSEERLRATLIARLAALLSPPRIRRVTALNLNPEGQAKKTLEALLGLFLESSKRHPVLLVVEDLEWIDPSTLNLLSLLVQRKIHGSLMVVLTFGPEFEPAWGQRAHLSLLELNRLSRQQQETLLDQMTVERPLSPALRREMIARADGVPLFLEELIRLAREGETPPPAAADSRRKPALPLSLRHCFTTRLEGLGPARELAQLAAVLGEELSADWLRAVSGLAEDELRHALDLLLEAEILIRGDPARDSLAFRHPLIRDAIHESMLEETRRAAHRRAAEVLRDAFPDLCERDPERMACHYTEAGMTAEAAKAWCLAARQAVRRAANLEAAALARQGLALFEALPDSDASRVEEIALHIVLGAALGTAKGYATPEAQAAYDRAVELAWQAPRSPDLYPEMQELVSYYLSRGQIRTAKAIAEKSLWHVEGRDLPEVLPSAWRNLGFAELLQGELESAVANLEKSLAPYSVHRSQMHATPPAIGIPLAETLSHLSLAEWFLGHPSQALKHSTDSLTLARRFNDPFSRVFTIYRASFLHVFRREPVATRELAHELVELANRHGFLFFIAAGMFLEGQALTAQGLGAEGLQMMSGGLDGVWASGMEVGRPRNLALLAEACGRSELVEQGLSLIKEGLAAMEISGEGHYEAEIYRIQGELLRVSGASEEEAEENLLQALDVARRQKSKSLELRAAMSLSRVWRDQNKVRQAVELLTTVYETFDEGFDTADLREAKELIDELS